MKTTLLFLIIYTLLVVLATAFLVYCMIIRNGKNEEQIPSSSSSPSYLQDKELSDTVKTPTFPSRNPQYSNKISFEQIGTLSSVAKGNDDDDNQRSKIILPLFARRLHHDRYEYYTVTENDMKLRIDIWHNNRVCSDTQIGCDEIYDGDIVKVPSYNGEFIVSKYSYRVTG